MFEKIKDTIYKIKDFYFVFFKNIRIFAIVPCLGKRDREVLSLCGAKVRH